MRAQTIHSSSGFATLPQNSRSVIDVAAVPFIRRRRDSFPLCALRTQVAANIFLSSSPGNERCSLAPSLPLRVHSGGDNSDDVECGGGGDARTSENGIEPSRPSRVPMLFPGISVKQFKRRRRRKKRKKRKKRTATAVGIFFFSAAAVLFQGRSSRVR